MKVVKVFAVMALVLMVAGLLFGTGCSSPGTAGQQGPKGDPGAQGPMGNTGSQGPAGQTGATGPQGPAGQAGATGAQGPAGSFAWGNPQTYGPIVLSIGTGSGSQSIQSLKPGCKVSYSFSSTGSAVSYWVRDPYNNIVLIGNAGYNTGSTAAMSGQGAFIAATSGTYQLSFLSSGVVTPSVLTINYTVYPTQ